MARSRNVKPGLSKNEDLAECSVWARLCFVLLPTMADREGRLEDRPKKIKGELFPFDTVDVDPLLAELDQHGFIARYTVDGVALIQIIAFLKHQHPHHKEPPSTLPCHPSLRLDSDGKWVKPRAAPRAEGPSDDTNAADKPETSPGLEPHAEGVEPGDGRGVEPGGFLIPDSRDLIPEERSGAAAPPQAALPAVSPAPAPPAAAPPPTQAAEQPLTPKERLWLVGVGILGAKGRPFIGKLVASYGEDLVAEAMDAAAIEQPGDPKSWLTAACATRAASGPKVNGKHAEPQTTLDLLKRDPRPQWAIDAGFEDIFAAESAGCGPGNFRNFRDGRKTA